MPAPYSDDLRERVISRVEGGASRREAAEHFEICASSAIKWLRRFEDTGQCKAMPSGGSVSPLDEHAPVLLAVIGEKSDMTLDEIVVAVCKRGIACSRTALWRFLGRHKITLKKKPFTQPNKNDLTWRRRADGGFGAKACSTRPG